jgi:hypothetical protein
VERGLSVSGFDSNVDASATITATFNAANGEVYGAKLDPLQAVSGSSDTCYTSTAVATTGKDGWVSGSTYTSEVYCFKFRELVIGTDGRIKVRDL